MVKHKKSLIAITWFLLISNLIEATPRSTYLESILLGLNKTHQVTQLQPTPEHRQEQPQTVAATVTNPLRKLTTTDGIAQQRATAHNTTQGQLPTRRPVLPAQKQEQEETSFIDMAGNAARKIRRLTGMTEMLNPQNFVTELIEKVTPNELKMALGIAENFLPGISNHCFGKVSNLALYPVRAFLENAVTPQKLAEGGAGIQLLNAAKTFMDFYSNPGRSSIGEAIVKRYFKDRDENDEIKQKALKAVRAGSVALDLNSLLASAYDIAQAHKQSGGRRDIPYFQVLVPALKQFTVAYQKFMVQYKSNNKALNIAQQAAETLLPILEKSKMNVPGLPMLNPLFIIDKVINIIKGGGMAKFMENQIAQQMAQFEGLE